MNEEKIEIDTTNPYTGKETPYVLPDLPNIDHENPYAPKEAPLTGPTTMKGPLGTMTVVPDDFSGKLPKGAVRQSDYRKMATVIGDIDDGTSQISIDTSNYTAGIDPETDPEGYAKALNEAQKFRDDHMTYLKDLVKTPTGLKMLQELSTSRHKTKIEHGDKNETERLDEDEAFRKDRGTGSTVRMDPTALTWQDEPGCIKPWMKERPRFGFYHEMVHAYHNARGTALHGYRGYDPEEDMTVGLKGYDDQGVTENAIRKEMGRDERPYYYAHNKAQEDYCSR